jgi:hypothetical protein
MKSPYLKVKIKTLMNEAQIIRKEMTKFMGCTSTYRKLHLHRVTEVRKEARATLVAYGFLNGLAYSAIEHACYEEPNWSRIRKMIVKYGEVGEPEERLVAFEAWRATTQDNRGMFRAVSQVAELVS